MTLPPFSSTCLRAQSSAINVLPEAVGLASTMFLPSSTPASMQSCWGGNNSDIPKPRSTSLTDSGTDNSAIFKVFAINFVVDSMGLGGLLEFFCNLTAFLPEYYCSIYKNKIIILLFDYFMEKKKIKGLRWFGH